MKLAKSFGLIATVLAASVAFAEPASFQIKTRRDDDSVQVRGDAGKTVFVVKSPTGISDATIDCRGEKWPEVVVLRLYLKGLESFQVSGGNVKLAASVSSQDGKTRLWQDNKEDLPLDIKSPLWMEIRRLDGDGQSAQSPPLQDGYFEMQLPKAIFEGAPRTIKLHWIDFYRN